MAPVPGTPKRSGGSRTRPRSSRPKSSGGRSDKATPVNAGSEPPQKKRRYIPGGPGGGGRYVDEDGTEIPVGGTGPGGYNYVGPRGRIGRENLANGVQPVVYPRRDRSTRARTTPRTQEPAMRFSSAAQAAAVVQSDGYKPREERAWEEFHPNLDIEAPLRAFSAEEVEGIPKAIPLTPGALGSPELSINGSNGIYSIEMPKPMSEGEGTPSGSVAGDTIITFAIPGTPGGGKRRPGRPPKDPVAFFAARAAKLSQGLTLPIAQNKSPKTPKVVVPPQQKERLTLPTPSYRKTDTLLRFEDKALGLVRYVDKSMANVGYQESDIFIRPERKLIKVSDTNLDEDLDLGPGFKSDGDSMITIASGGVGRVEYDMDEQDDKWLQEYNNERKALEFEPITREIFEITITKIEKEWHALEKRIPKPNPKPPQTHRPRSSSAAAVNGEPFPGEEQDSKCAICDDGDCENTNAIVFCDGCDLAVHQECYGVPFIPEGQWLCRKCQLIGRGIPTCIFCPNTDGAFKQTNASKWAHLLCAMWIPEVSLGNHTFMEPVMDVEKVPKTRWKLTCYICQQRMGACIQCGNKACYQAFHVTCARRARLFLKMKNNHGTLAVLDGTTVLKAFCDKHCPPDYARDNEVVAATREARIFYKRTMRGRLWADSQASALAMAARHNAIAEHQPDESQAAGARASLVAADPKKKGSQPQKPIWKLPSGAPVIPQVVYNAVESSLQRFTIRRRKEFAADACRYWTLKREARRGAALLKRLQLQMETFSSMELTRRNFAAMGHAGRARLDRRIEFAKTLIKDLERLKELTQAVKQRELEKLQAAELEADAVDTIYFPVAKLLPPIVEKALALDIKSVFTTGLVDLSLKLQKRFYVTALSFLHDFCEVFRIGINTEPAAEIQLNGESGSAESLVPSLKPIVDIKERRKLGKRIIKAVQAQLEAAVRAEADILQKPTDKPLKELESMLEACLETRRGSITTSIGESTGDMEVENEADHQTAIDHQIKLDELSQGNGETFENGESSITIPDVADAMDVDADGEYEDTIIAEPKKEAMELDTDAHGEDDTSKNQSNGIESTNTPPDTNGYSAPENPARPGPPTPPISNGDTGTSTDPSDVLTSGGIPWFLKDFQPEGTTLVESQWIGREVVSRLSEELSDMDDDELKGLGIDVEEAGMGVTDVVSVSAEVEKATPARTKKGKVKKRWRGYK
ncbi:hypothetical protein F5884DRAFT_774113 [Xylogone sp. PMI_703]|nr:hypothetical protein F5884DRAFT_774113 [Xylogone sp. PMI_703]